jgi:peptide/nickel transport system substrate-binding protein
LADPTLARREVRAAIAHAIDREAIIRFLFGGRARVAESVLSPTHWAAATDLAPYAHDPALARDYLRRAGFSDERPLVLSYKTSTDPFRLRIAHVLQSQLAEAGIRLEIGSYDWGTFFGDIKAGRFQMYSLSWVGVSSPDILRYAFHSASTPPAGANRGRYRSVEVDRLIGLAESADPGSAAALYADVQRQLHRDLVYVPLWYEANVAVSRGLTGYAPGHDGNYLALNRVMMSNADGR